MILTTTPTIEGRTIVEYQGVVFGEVIAGVILMFLVQFLPDSERAGKLVSFFVAIGMIAALVVGFKDYRNDNGKE